MPVGRKSLTVAALVAFLSSCVAHKERGEPDRDADAPAAPIALPSTPPAAEPLRHDDAAAAVAIPTVKSATPSHPVPASLDRLARDPFMPDLSTPGRVEIGRVGVSGALVAGAERTVMRMKGGFRACLSPDAEQQGGRLTLDVLVGENGSALSAKATHVEALDAASVGCMERRALAATFRAPVGGQAHVIVPVVVGERPADGG
jgi:hypothetical protein